MRAIDNLKVGVKLTGGFLLVAVIVLVVAVVSYLNMQELADGMNSMYVDRTLPIEDLGHAMEILAMIHGDLHRYLLIPEERSAIQGRITAGLEEIQERMNKYRATYLMDDEKAELIVFEDAWKKYQDSVQEIIRLANGGEAQAALASLLEGGNASIANNAVDVSMEKLIDINSRIAAELNQQGHVMEANAMRMLIVFGSLGVAAAVGLGIFLTRGITAPLSIVVSAAHALAQGDMVRDLDESVKDKVRLRKDEIGEIGKAFDGMIEYMQGMGEAAGKVADNDLTVTVTPASAKDELGNAFARMLANLRRTVNKVADSANSLSAASGQLAAAANQAGQATGQIASTVQQVAKGTAQQSDSISRTAASVEQMSRAIDGVAKGSQEQARAVGQASNITSEITTAIQQVAGNAEAVTRESAGAADAAASGVKVVGQTVKGMEAIKAKVGASAEKVQEMGRRSDQIGAIVETIEDIASQTNLLALNAAIEAARAGEHGKGFAVVADEVRKLAERASAATKEIGGLIKGIQQTVSEAVAAMNEGAREVENGVGLANQAGDALNGIARAVQSAYAQAEQAAEAAQRMMTASNRLVGAMDSVSAVVEENTAATEEMAASSNEVTQAIENIASVSEENSAAIEEVSASAEEMSAQVEEVTASAQSLSEMAQALTQVVAEFKLDEGNFSRQQIDLCKQAHIQWVEKLNSMLAGRVKLRSDEVASHTNCILGSWYYHIGGELYGHLPEFIAVEAPHTRMHAQVRQAVETFNRGDKTSAERIVKDVAHLSQEIVGALDKLEARINTAGVQQASAWKATPAPLHAGNGHGVKQFAR
jgi:methyl-accepting chemotaxis protein